MIYLDGCSEAEGNRPVERAEFWRDRLIVPGTRLAPGTRLLHIGCGVGAVLGILDGAFPALALSGVDIEPVQIATARRRLDRPGIPIELSVADGRDLPYVDGSFDHVWIQFLLECLHSDGARKVLQEAHRVLTKRGRLTVIEADYHTLRISSGLDPLLSGVVRAVDSYGQSDAGARLGDWLHEGGWSDIDRVPNLVGFPGAATEYIAGAWKKTTSDAPSLAGVHATGDLSPASIEMTVYKATARP